MLQQALEEIELLRGEIHLVAVHAHATGPRIEADRTVHQRGVGLVASGARAACERVDTRQELVEGERLHEVVVGPGRAVLPRDPRPCRGP